MAGRQRGQGRPEPFKVGHLEHAIRQSLELPDVTAGSGLVEDEDTCAAMSQPDGQKRPSPPTDGTPLESRAAQRRAAMDRRRIELQIRAVIVPYRVEVSRRDPLPSKGFVRRLAPCWTGSRGRHGHTPTWHKS